MEEVKTVCLDSFQPSRMDQLDVWDRLPLTNEQRGRVLAAMRKAKDEEDAAKAAKSGLDLDVDRKEVTL